MCAKNSSIVTWAVLAVVGPCALAQEYTFTKIADSALLDFDPFSFGAPSISDAGHVAFRAQSSDQTVTSIWRTGASLAGPLTLIVDSSGPVGGLSRNVSVNNLGQVAVWAPVSGATIDERIMRGDGNGTPTTIAEAGPSPHPFSFMSVIVSVNDSGAVAWQGELRQAGFPQGLFTGNGGPHNTIFDTASSNFTSSFAGPMINNAGQIAFRAATTASGGDAIFRYDGSGAFTAIADQSHPLVGSTMDDEPAINASGRVAFIGRGDDVSTMYLLVGDGTTDAVAVVNTTGPLDSINNAAINDLNQIAYSATFDDFTTTGIFTGPDLVNDAVVRTGDVIDGSAVTFVSFYREGLNNSGQIAFFAQLADGRGVVMVATPVPTTGVLALAAVASPFVLRRRR
ncbi:MAG TPA: choice-of-anchor tandem repeat NxxGxxAF-containing protein [Phycisphaerales bacterium]|nr:choice-of-anchor tandem repeat NxxGxxAF-containing protein [Phycisphaerales bacterium]